MRIGKVYIVGAGPGDPGLITVKGLEAIKKADVIVYDRLVNPELLSYAKPSSIKVFVGKERGLHYMEQDEINELMAKEALKGKTVVRLKGGDPYVFGRGEEECIYLIEKGIECEVIPGVTSATAVPAYAGIPVTSRGIASSFTVVSGTLASKERSVDYSRIISSSDTMVVLMGTSNVSKIVDGILKAKGEDFPSAVIEMGTTPNQRTIVSNVRELESLMKHLNFKPPTVMVFGEVVKLRDRLWKLC